MVDKYNCTVLVLVRILMPDTDIKLKVSVMFIKNKHIVFIGRTANILECLPLCGTVVFVVVLGSRDRGFDSWRTHITQFGKENCRDSK